MCTKILSTLIFSLLKHSKIEFVILKIEQTSDEQWSNLKEMFNYATCIHRCVPELQTAAINKLNANKTKQQQGH